jgi:hypothetical protein
VVSGPGPHLPSSARPEPQRRVILLGASNLARGFSTVVDTARATWPVPLDILGAIGHGRSYGQSSFVLGRGLPGIRACGLWQALREGPKLPTTALVTDIGNDLLYGALVGHVVDWVQQCLDAMQPHCEAVVVMLPPVQTVRRMRRKQFQLMRTLFFPSSRLTFEQALERAEQLNDNLTTLLRARGLQEIEPSGDWYGFDPIHIRRRSFSTAWQAAFAPFRDPPADAVKRISWPHWWRLHSMAPQRRWLLGIERCRRQPSLYLSDGARVSLY